MKKVPSDLIRKIFDHLFPVEVELDSILKRPRRAVPSAED